MSSLVTLHHPHRPCLYLGCKTVNRFIHIGSAYLEVGASSKPDAVQTPATRDDTLSDNPDVSVDLD
jgi:hypothetical protein